MVTRPPRRCAPHRSFRQGSASLPRAGSTPARACARYSSQSRLCLRPASTTRLPPSKPCTTNFRRCTSAATRSQWATSVRPTWTSIRASKLPTARAARSARCASSNSRWPSATPTRACLPGTCTFHPCWWTWTAATAMPSTWRARPSSTSAQVSPPATWRIRSSPSAAGILLVKR